MPFVEVKIKVPSANRDILIAELNEFGYNSFNEVEEGLDAYIDTDLFQQEFLVRLQQKYQEQFQLTFTFSLLEDKNWNAVWEQNFEPVIVGDKCIVRASFHTPAIRYPHEIVINPKMSFGTGHHATTFMMIEHMLEIDLRGKTVLDAGSGTGVLAILASQLGVRVVYAIDIEDWAFTNCKENIVENHCKNVYVLQGTIASAGLPPILFDGIVANINKNVLLKEILVYSQFLKDEGILLLSGFYSEDILDINAEASKYFLGKRQKIKDNWASVLYEKKKPI